MDPELMLLELKKLTTSFQELNQHTLGKIHTYRLKERLRSQSRGDLDKSVEEEQQCTFRPKINRNSKALDEKRIR